MESIRFLSNWYVYCYLLIPGGGEGGAGVTRSLRNDHSALLWNPRRLRVSIRSEGKRRLSCELEGRPGIRALPVELPRHSLLTPTTVDNRWLR